MGEKIGKILECNPDEGQGEGYQVVYPVDVLKERVNIGDETLNLYIKDGLVVGVDTGTVFKGPLPTTGMMYGLTEIVEENGQINPKTSTAIIAERDRYDGGSSREISLEKIYDIGWRIPEYTLKDLLGKKTDEIDLLKK